MNPSAAVSQATRRAALLVHAMPQRDQEWLLGSLAPHDRVEIENLLDELRTLGIRGDEQLLRDVVRAPAPSQSSTPLSWHERLDALAPMQIPALVSVLQKEPPQLVATLLAIRAWPWKEAVLRGLEPALAQQVGNARAGGGALLQQAIGETVLRQVGACARPAAQPAPAVRWTRMLPIRFRKGA